MALSSRYDSDRELWGDGPDLALVPTATPGRKRETKSEAAARRMTKKRSETSQLGGQTKRRRRWEGSPQGQDRLRDVVDYATEQHNRIARERPELGLAEQARLRITPRQAYEHYGFSEHHTGPRMEEEQLPGMGDPHALPRPKRWEEYSPEERTVISRKVKLRSGADVDTMTKSFGSQLDQSYTRAREHGHDAPWSQDFYLGTSEPGRVLRESASRTGAPLGLVAATNSDTSPQMRFRHVNQQGGVSYPNAEQAEYAIRHAQDTGTGYGVTKEGLSGLARTGFDKNLRKATQRAHEVLNEGKTVPETYGGFGPKTAAYHNSWLGGEPDFFVSDVHSGGGGMVPHLSSEKPLKRDRETGETEYWESGVPKRGRSAREEAVNTGGKGGFHAMADYAARGAMASRGLGRIRQAQASQWGEEQIRRGEEGSRFMPKASEVYPRRVVSQQQFSSHGQEKLF